jgi:hypothetical protein
MTEKITIKAEQVVSRKGGYVSYYDEGNTLRKAKANIVTVLEAGQEAPPADPQTQSAPADAAPSAPVYTDGEVPTNTVEVTEPAAPTESKPKPSKRGTKPKEDADMATKTAAKKSAPKKAPAKKTAAPRAKTEGGSVRTIGGKPVDISKYEKAKAPGGGTSYNNGDPVAEKLQGKDLDTVYDIVAKALKCEVKELKSKYKHLNVGMQRMNLGNRLRKVALPREK